MLTLKVYNSKVEIFTKDEDLLKRSKKLLNIYFPDPVDRTKFSSIYIGRGNMFPSGYLSQFEKKAKTKKIDYMIEDHRSDNVQRQSLKFNCPYAIMPHQELARAATDANKTGTVSSPTASGKSLMMALTIASKHTTTLVIVPTTSIRDELLDNYREWFGSKTVGSDIPVKPWAPGLGSKTVAQSEDSEVSEESTEPDENPYAYLLKKKPKTKVKEDPFVRMKRMQLESIQRKLEKGNWYKPITILCWNSLPLLPKEYIQNIGCVIIDECHTASVKAIRNLLFAAERATYRYGFSATPWRDQPHMFKLMQSALGSEIIFDYSPEDAIDDDVIAKPNLNIIEAAFPTKFLKNVKNYRKLLDEGIIRNKARNEQIVKKAIELYDDNHQVFIAIDEIGQFEGKMVEVKKPGASEDAPKEFVRDKDISYCLKSLFEARSQSVIFISGDDSNSEKKRKIKELREETGGFILVGTMAVGIGTDIPGINKIIMAATGKSSIKFLQRIGRGMRTNNESNKQLDVFDFMDRWNPIVKAFTIERVKAFTKHFKGCKVFGF
jgi:superfamily II DNA or RNA helicase